MASSTKVRIVAFVQGAALAGALIVLSMQGYGQGNLAGVASVVDGDTLEIQGVRVRLHGIDAPESRQECAESTGASWRCGQKAATALSDRIGRSPVACEPRGRDRYGRVIAVCFSGNVDLGRWMVATGWAVAYRKYAMDYVPDEDAAKFAKVGIWAGRFQMPWDWRAGVPYQLRQQKIR